MGALTLNLFKSETIFIGAQGKKGTVLLLGRVHLPGGTVSARGLNSAAGDVIGGVGFPCCHCKEENGPCLAL